MDFWELLLSDLDIKIMVFARILGIFSFNPILSRSNIPARVRVGLSLLIAYIVALALPPMEFDADPYIDIWIWVEGSKTFAIPRPA